MILHTGIALGVTLVVLAGVLAVLQYRDKVCWFCFVKNDWKFLIEFRLRMIANEKCNPKDFIMMLYDFE